MQVVTVKKLSVALHPEVADAAARAADEAGLSMSAWLNRAATHELAIASGLAAVREWEQEHGAFTEAELALADAVLDGHSPRPSRRRR